MIEIYKLSFQYDNKLFHYKMHYDKCHSRLSVSHCEEFFSFMREESKCLDKYEYANGEYILEEEWEEVLKLFYMYYKFGGDKFIAEWVNFDLYDGMKRDELSATQLYHFLIHIHKMLDLDFYEVLNKRCYVLVIHDLRQFTKYFVHPRCYKKVMSETANQCFRGGVIDKKKDNKIPFIRPKYKNDLVEATIIGWSTRADFTGQIWDMDFYNPFCYYCNRFCFSTVFRESVIPVINNVDESMFTETDKSFEADGLSHEFDLIANL